MYVLMCKGTEMEVLAAKYIKKELTFTQFGSFVQIQAVKCPLTNKSQLQSNMVLLLLIRHNTVCKLCEAQTQPDNLC